MELTEWGPDRADDLAALVAAALPDEDLTAEELLGVCFEPAGVVLATTDGLGAVAAVVRGHRDAPWASVALLVVHPDGQRQGRGRALLAAAEGWAGGLGAVGVVLGGGAPFYLWPGVEHGQVAMTEMARAAGYQEAFEPLVDMSLRVGHRAEAPVGVVIRRVRSPEDRAAVRSWCTERWPEWLAEVDRAVGFGTCHGAFASGTGSAGEAVAGVACHSVSRAGRIGPMATDPDHQGRGIGLALLGAVCRDLDLAEFDRAHVSWVGPRGFYARAGAEVCARYRTFTRSLTG